MKKQILQQSYPSDNSSQFETEVPLPSAAEWGLYFFFWEYFFLLLPVSLPHTTWESDYINKTVKQITTFSGKRVVSFPLSFTSLYLTLI